MKLLRLIANLGYGSRRQVMTLCRDGRVTDPDGNLLGAHDEVEHAHVRIDGEALDPPQGMLLMLHKPVGYTCSHRDQGRLVYGLLPPRFAMRKPVLSSIGRLDRDTSGLLLFTDDGALLHRIISPKRHIAKVYEATLAEPLRADAEAIFASGTLMLDGETTPLAPAQLQRLDSQRVRMTVTEGRYHQVRRMFAALGSHVRTLQRTHLGGLPLNGLPAGAWRLLDAGDVERIFGGAP